MSRFLLDTHIISELTKPSPDQGVVRFLSELSSAYLSTVTLHELEYGIGLLPIGKRRSAIERVIAQFIEQYHNAILAINAPEAHAAALLRLTAKQQGQVLHLADSLIAGTAQVHQLTVVTRNAKDFAGLSVAVLNPFLDE